jgi:hypothetical protein
MVDVESLASDNIGQHAANDDEEVFQRDDDTHRPS